MFEKKSVVIVSAILLTLIGSPLAANAQTPAAVFTTAPTPIFQDDDDEYEDEDGDDDSLGHEHDEQHEIIPPVVTVPGFKRDHHNHPPKNGLPTPPPETLPGGADTTTNTQSLGGIDVTDAEFVVVASDDPAGEIPLEIGHPTESSPIDVKLISAQVHNPADRFMESAYIGMGVLAATALGLGATSAVRAIRVRRAGKADYFYDNK